MTFPSRIVGLAIVGSVAVLSTSGARGSGHIPDLPALFYILAIILGGLTISFGVSGVWHAIRHCAGAPMASQQDLSGGITILQRARQLSWAGGFLGMLTGLIDILVNSDFSGHQLLVGGGIALTCLLYGAFIAEVIISPVKHSLLARHGGHFKEASSVGAA
jgi:hypothetical protein